MATATKKAAPAAKKAPGKQIANWDAELAKMAELSKGIEANVGAGGNYLSTRGGNLQYKDANIPGNKINVVILDHILENAFYEGRYDPENPSGPVCFAFGRDEDEMKPHADSPEPQHPTCKGCPMNEFGSADTGRGKACKNSRRLAMITEDGLEDIADAEVAMLKLPVTSIKNWAGYVRQLADSLKRPPLGVVTEISVVPNAKTQFEVKFRLIGTIDDSESIGEIIEKRATVEQNLFQPYQQREEEEKPARGRGAKPAARKKIGGKR